VLLKKIVELLHFQAIVANHPHVSSKMCIHCMSLHPDKQQCIEAIPTSAVGVDEGKNGEFVNKSICNIGGNKYACTFESLKLIFHTLPGNCWW
jgi:hypothetical protein